MRKRTDEWKLKHTVIPDNFYEGWYAGINNMLRPSLEYASTSGYYHLNEARKIANDAGYKLGQEMLKKACASLQERPQFPTYYSEEKAGKPDIPAEVKSLCYASIK
jgi:hypothetical protein